MQQVLNKCYAMPSYPIPYPSTHPFRLGFGGANSTNALGVSWWDKSDFLMLTSQLALPHLCTDVEGEFTIEIRGTCKAKSLRV